MTIRTRPATLDDAPALARIHVESWKEAYQEVLPQSLLDDLSIGAREKDWKQWLAGDVWTTTVAEADGVVVAFCSIDLTSEDGRNGEIAALYVSPDRWRSGFGRTLLRDAFAELRLRGKEEVILWVFADNEPAISFYARFGFTPDGGKMLHEASGQEAVRLRADLGENP